MRISKWLQLNSSDKVGTIAYSKNVNLDEEGYLKLSPRAVAVLDEADDPTNVGVPLAIGRYSASNYLVADTVEGHVVSLSTSALSPTLDDGFNAPDLTVNSHAAFWQSRWYASLGTKVWSRPLTDGASATWTERITGLTSTVRKCLRVFENRQTLCVTDGNVLKQFDTSHSSTTNLTIPADFEMVGIDYNAHRMGIITRLSGSTEGQNREAFFFVWDGTTTSANAGVALGAASGIAVKAYRSSFVVLNQAGQLLYWNGGGLVPMDKAGIGPEASLPFYFNDKIWGDLLNQKGKGDLMTVEGDCIYLNLGLELETFGRANERTFPANPSGVWCYDPKVGLYHRASPSISKATLLDVSSVNTTTDVITVSSGTIPATGNPVRYTAAGATPIGGLTLFQDYYVIKLTSTTFKLATTKANALAGTAIDLTSNDASSYFWAYDLVDYGTTYAENVGAIAVTRANSNILGEFMFGGAYLSTANAEVATLCITVPYLENRGYVVTAKAFAEGPDGQISPLTVKYRPLGDNDAIVVKGRTRAFQGLPQSTTGTYQGSAVDGEWSSDTVVFSDGDFSAVKALFDAGIELELEVVAGAGGGTCVKVENIWLEGTTYAFQLAEAVIGASSGRKCHFIVDHWKELHTITSTSEREDGYATIPCDLKGKWVQYKIELRGSETTIEELL